MPGPVLTLPTTRVRVSYVQAAIELVHEGTMRDFGPEDAADFSFYVQERRVVRQGWGVPFTELWYVDGTEYLGTVMIRHQLTPALLEAGGHIGYHVAPRHRGHGHATRMLRQALEFCRGIGLTTVLITAAEENVASQRVIEANGGRLEDTRDGERRYWVPA